MKIALPIDNNMIAGHFGHASKFALVSVDGGKIGGSELLTPPPHEPGVLPRWLKDIGATHLICGGIGARAVELLQESGVQVIAGVPVMDPSEAVEAFLAGRIRGATGPTCTGHGPEGHSCRH